MIGRLAGVLKELDGNLALIDINGVGYEVFVTRETREGLEVGKPCVVLIHTDVREDAFQLFGFLSGLERTTFKLLLRVNGIGAKTALEMLSHISARELLKVIAASDLTALQRVKGIGKKTAERLIIELRERVSEFSLGGGSPSSTTSIQLIPAHDDAVAALIALGFQRKEAEAAVAKAKDGNRIVETSDIIREALRFV